MVYTGAKSLNWDEDGRVGVQWGQKGLNWVGAMGKGSSKLKMYKKSHIGTNT